MRSFPRGEHALHLEECKRSKAFNQCPLRPTLCHARPGPERGNYPTKSLCGELMVRGAETHSPGLR